MKRIYALAIAQCAVLGALTAPAVVGLSLMVSRMVGEADAPAVLSVLVASGSAAAMISNPLFGWCADRTPARRGGRRAWLIGGAIAGLVGSAAVAMATDPAVLWIAWVLTQIAYNACFAAVNSMVSRGLAPEHRVRVGAVFAAMSFLGTVPGLAAAALFSADTVIMTLAVPAVAAIVVPIVALRLADPDDGGEPARVGGLAELRAILTRRFLAIMTVRFVFSVELTAGLVFGLYLFQQRWDLPESDAVRLVSASTLIGVIGLVAATATLSLLRRRTPDERALLAGAILALVAAMVGRALAGSPVLFQVATFVAGAAIGVGFASSRAVVQALLPPSRAAFGLGVFGAANNLAPIVAPLVAAALLTIGGHVVDDAYAGMYVLLAVPVLACLAVLPALRPARPAETREPDRVTD
jgi:MFS family permease